MNTSIHISKGKHDSKYTTTARQVVAGTCEVHPQERDRLLHEILQERDELLSLLVAIYPALQFAVADPIQARDEIHRRYKDLTSLFLRLEREAT